MSRGANAQVPPDLAAQTRAAGRTMNPASGAGYAALFPPSMWDGNMFPHLDKGKANNLAKERAG